jgi:hypothetical protein
MMPGDATGLARLARLAFATGSVGLAVACGFGDPVPYKSDGSRTIKPPVEAPVDRLAPGELEPSDQIAFGLPIPRGMKVTHRFDGATHAQGAVEHDELIEYLKRRLAGSHIKYELKKVIFSDVRVRDAASPGPNAAGGPEAEAKPKAGDATLRVEVWGNRKTTFMSVVDTTKPVVVPGLTEAERWRRAGMHPDGSPLDPDSLK